MADAARPRIVDEANFPSGSPLYVTAGGRREPHEALHGKRRLFLGSTA